MRCPMVGAGACLAIEMYFQAKRESEERRKAAIPFIDRTGSFVADYLDKTGPSLQRHEWRTDSLKTKALDDNWMRVAPGTDAAIWRPWSRETGEL